jgi:hypothetical protein
MVSSSLAPSCANAGEENANGAAHTLANKSAYRAVSPNRFMDLLLRLSSLAAALCG